MNMKKCSILLLIGAVVIGMSAMTASAEEEPMPDVEIEHDASNGERGLDTVNEEDNPDDTLIIAPNPHTPDSPYWDGEEDILSGRENSDGEEVVTDEDYNPDETFILANEEKNDNPVETPVVLGFAGLGAIVLLAIGLIVLKRKK